MKCFETTEKTLEPNESKNLTQSNHQKLIKKDQVVSFLRLKSPYKID